MRTTAFIGLLVSPLALCSCSFDPQSDGSHEAPESVATATAAVVSDPTGNADDDSKDIPPELSTKELINSIKALGADIAKIAGGIEKAIAVYNNPTQILSVLGMGTPAGHTIEDVYQGIQEVLIAASGTSWEITEGRVTDNMAVIQTAMDMVKYCATTNQSPCPSLAPYLTAGVEVDVRTSMNAIEGNPTMDFTKLPQAALRNNVETVTNGTKVNIPSSSWEQVHWKDIVKTRAALVNGYDNMVFDWRLAVPVVMNAISKHLLVMASSSPTYQCDPYFTPIIQRHIDVLQILHDEMLKNVHCNFKLHNIATPVASVMTMCADVNTGLASQLAESDGFCPIRLYNCPELGGAVNSVPDDYDMTKCSIGTGGCRASNEQFTWAHANPSQIAANMKLMRSQVIAGMPVQAVKDTIAALKRILATSCLPPAIDASAWAQGSVGTSTQSYPRDFNAFAQGAVGGLRDVQGSLAGGGAISLSSMNINPLKRDVGIVSGGFLTLKYGTVYGSIYEGAGGNLTSVSYDGSKLYSSSPIAFDAAFQQLATFSSQVAALKNGALPNSTYVGSKSTPYYGNLKLSSPNPVLSVFNLTPSDFNNTYQIEFAVPSTSTVIVNVTGTAPVMLQNAGLKLNGVSPSKILWNFPETGSVTVQSVGMNGSILAPYATLNLKYGHEYGTIVGKTISSDTELYEAPFKGNWLVP